MALRGKKLLSNEDAGHIVVRGCRSHGGGFHSALGRRRKIWESVGSFPKPLENVTCPRAAFHHFN